MKATVSQILQLEKAGCEIIRCAIPTMEAAKSLEEIKKQIKRAIEQKPAAHCFEEPGAITEAHQMAQIGG